MELREPSQRVSARARLMWISTAAVESVVVVVALAGGGGVETALADELRRRGAQKE